MKKQYTQADLEILSFADEDIIVTSGEGNNETSKMPWNSGGTDPYSTVQP